MSDTKWLKSQGFESVEELPSGFSLLVKKINPKAHNPTFTNSSKTNNLIDKNGLVAYYSNRCPFSEYHVTTSLVESAKKRNLPLKVIKLETFEQAQSAPTPATLSVYSITESSLQPT